MAIHRPLFGSVLPKGNTHFIVGAFDSAGAAALHIAWAAGGVLVSVSGRGHWGAVVFFGGHCFFHPFVFCEKIGYWP